MGFFDEDNPLFFKIGAAGAPGEGGLRPSRPKPSGMAASGAPAFAVLTCSDLGVLPETIFELDPGELYVMQSPAYAIGEGELAGALFAHKALGLDVLIVVGHYPCRCLERSGLHGHGAFVGDGELQVDLSDPSLRGAPPDDRRIARIRAKRTAEHLQSRVDGSGITVLAAHFEEDTHELELLSAHSEVPLA